MVTIDKKLMAFTYLFCGIKKGRQEFSVAELNSYFGIAAEGIRKNFGRVHEETLPEHPIKTVVNYLNCYEFDGVRAYINDNGGHNIKLSDDLFKRFKEPNEKDSQYEYITFLMGGFTTEDPLGAGYVNVIYESGFIPVDRSFFLNANQPERNFYIECANELLGTNNNPVYSMGGGTAASQTTNPT